MGLFNISLLLTCLMVLPYFTLVRPKIHPKTILRFITMPVPKSESGLCLGMPTWHPEHKTMPTQELVIVT
nr:MisS_P14 [synthetic construct]